MSTETIITYTCPDCGHTTDVVEGVTVCAGCCAPFPIVAVDKRPPEWAAAYFHDVRDLLGIGNDWNLWLEFSDRVPGDEDEDGSNAPEYDGNCALDARYLKATITVRRGLSEERARSVIMHELLHVSLAPLDLAFQRLRELLPAKLWVHAMQLYTDAEEQTIERLTRGLQRSVRPPASEEPAP